MATKGSFPTTHASCPAGMQAKSPGFNSVLEPSSMAIVKRPLITYWA